MAADVIASPTNDADIKSHLATSGLALQSATLGTGSNVQVGVYNSLDLGSSLTTGKGVLLTTGYGRANRTNSVDDQSYNVTTSGGDADLTHFADTSGNYSDTYDAAVLTLSIKVTDAKVSSVRFDLILGSEEFPAFTDSGYTDIAAVWTGTGPTAHNHALLDGKADATLRVRNLPDSILDNSNSSFHIEYNGLVPHLVVFVPVKQGMNTIKIGIADISDHTLDSGLFINGITGTSYDWSGATQEIGVGTLKSYSANDGGKYFSGTSSQIDGTTFKSFGADDALFIKGRHLDGNDVQFDRNGTVELDVNGDGELDTEFSFGGTVKNATLRLADGPTGTHLTLDLLKSGTNGDNKINGTSQADYISGGKGADKLSGNGRSDFLSGGDDRDELNGGDGRDVLRGGDGKDKLIGGDGKDVLRGDDGADQFRFNSKGEGGDTILDFKHGTDDLVFKSSAFGGLHKVTDSGASASYVENNSGDATTSHHRFILEKDTHILRYDADGKGGHDSVVIATLNVSHLTSGDFLFI